MARGGVRRVVLGERGCREGGLCYLLGFACPVHYESCIAHFMASVLEQIITGWREREREKGGGGWAWFCSQKMSSRVSSLQIPDYAHPYNCFTLSTDLFTLFIYSGIQQVSLTPPSTLQNNFCGYAALQKKSFLCLNKQSNFSTRAIKTTEIDSFAWILELRR